MVIAGMVKDEARAKVCRHHLTGVYDCTVEKIRRAEYPQLQRTIYLDHAGTTPHPRSLVNGFAEDMKANLFGNPHSQSPSSLLSTQRIESVRAQVLAFFKADPAGFDVVFVANATAAIKLVMDGFRDHDRSLHSNAFWYGYHADSHTSLVGVREVAAVGARCFASDSEVEDWLAGTAPSPPSSQGTPEPRSIGLFAYPAQSNMNGRRLPLTWPGQLRASRHAQHQNVFSLLDAATFASTAQLDLSDWHNAPDFVALSFYKIFGFPDLGALIVRSTAGDVLCRRPYFGGGTVDMVINAAIHPGEAWHARKRMTIHEALEDGTPAFHSILALESALKVHRALFGSMDQVSQHAGYLAKTLYEALSSMKHANGARVCKIYKGVASEYSQTKTQGPIIAFNVQTADGRWIAKSHIEQLAILNKIQLRSGGVCNPGGIAHFLDMTAQELRQNFRKGLRCGNTLDIIDGKPTGIVRVSLGAMSSMKDVRKFITFMHLFVDSSVPALMSSASPLFDPGMAYERLALEKGLKKVIVPSLTTSIQKDEIMEQIDCPVATCHAIFNSEPELQAHFQVHQVITLSWRIYFRAWRKWF